MSNPHRRRWWTEERVALLRSLAAQGTTGREAAEVFGKSKDALGAAARWYGVKFHGHRSERAAAHRRAAQKRAMEAWSIQWWPEMDAVLDTAPRPLEIRPAARRIGVSWGTVKRRCIARGIETRRKGRSAEPIEAASHG